MDQRSRDCGPLRLAAGHLTDPTVDQVGQPEALEHLAGPAARAPRSGTGDPKRQLDVLPQAQLGHEVAELEDKAHLAQPQRRPPPLRQQVQPLAAEVDLPRVGDEEPGQEVQQGGLAGPGRAHDRDHLTWVDAEVDTAQHRCRAVCVVQTARAQHPARWISGLGPSAGRRLGDRHSPLTSRLRSPSRVAAISSQRISASRCCVS